MHVYLTEKNITVTANSFFCDDKIYYNALDWPITMYIISNKLSSVPLILLLNSISDPV